LSDDLAYSACLYGDLRDEAREHKCSVVLILKTAATTMQWLQSAVVLA
jgi:hypothetical protein